MDYVHSYDSLGVDVKYRDLEAHLVWLHHNDTKTLQVWGKNLQDMWTEPYGETKARNRRRKRRGKGVEPASKQGVFEAICGVLEQNDFNKLMIHLYLSG